MYLWKRSAWWDVTAAACGELALVFTCLTLITGAIWGRPTWGTFWVWDPRLTATAMLALLLLGYLAVRRLPGDQASRARRSAVVGLLVLPNVFLDNRAVTWWRSLHQGTTILETLQPKIHDQMAFALVFNIFVGLLVGSWLLVHRWRLAWLEQQAEAAELDEAIAERRAEGAPSGRAEGAPSGQAEGAPSGKAEGARASGIAAARSFGGTMSDWGYVGLGWGIATVVLGGLRPVDRAARPGRQPSRAARGPPMAVIDPPSGASTPGPDDADGSIDPIESSDATSGTAGLDLSPRVLPSRRRGRGWAAKIALVAILVAAGFVVSKALTSASLFFYNADEAVAKEPTLGTSTFRIQGTVENDVKRTSDGADFTITYNGRRGAGRPHRRPAPAVQARRARGAPGPLRPRRPAPVPVSDHMLVKHDATYTAKNGARLKQAEKGGKVAPKTTTTTTPARSGASTQP